MKIYLDTIGCRLNQSEIEIMAAQFRRAGHVIVPESAQADLVVVNTCAVTSAAASDSRQKVRQAARNQQAKIVVTGCWATLEPQAALQLPGVESVVMNDHKDSLVADTLQIKPEVFDVEPLAREVLPGEHYRTRAFLKVQDGCDNFCTFCVTKVARGKGVSRALDAVLQDVRGALAGGVQEVVLSGVHLGSWGRDLSASLRLSDLIRAILENTPVSRLRLSSLEPWDLDDNFFNLWQDPRLCGHLHLPLQSGSADILKRMARKTTPQAYRLIVEEARAVVPQIAITTDMIVGFPGESDTEFEESLEYARSLGFAGGHVFSFSPRPGTPAAKYSEQVPGPIKKRRSAVLRALFAEAAYTYQKPLLGEHVDVLWEGAQKNADGTWQMKGLTGNYLKVTANTVRNAWNEIQTIRLTGFSEDGLTGMVLQ
ncbi:MAG: tRNA (N(6)-L-threonylcarbamoyladenosine(37)-C(2))-methylthiotransferase MtaB [Chloroflexi bacterium HGW-Chloroflexi-10]|nr:MAG: tRNA (N(6)-L-threonylcarbamoyladenosine(37)-C(2))-methylthiotransferase MtaB [Chloroflexi bacterium HGW-Chloroflexi-10]